MKQHVLDIDPDLIEDFVDETEQNLRLAREALFTLSQGKSSAAEDLLRPIHNIKGSAGFLRLSFIQDFAHEFETVLDQIMAGKLKPSERVQALVASSIDVLDRYIRSVEQAFHGNKVVEVPDQMESLLVDFQRLELEDSQRDPLEGQITGAVQPVVPVMDHIKIPHKDYQGLLKRLIELQTGGEAVLGDQELLDRLEEEQKKRLLRLKEGLEKVTKELKKLGQKRFSSLYPFLRQAAQDVADREGKELSFETGTEDVGVDSLLIQKLREPLMHLVRNAVYHGLETPKERAARGKDEDGRVAVLVQQEEKCIKVIVEDDGRGINVHRIRERLKEMGHSVADNQEELIQAVFMTGFSTADLGLIAGRGIGLDVVKKNVEDLGGTVRLKSQTGQGCRFELEIPTSLSG